MKRVPAHEHVLDTGKGEFTLDDLGPLLPGMAEIMPLVGSRVWKCYYAGQARNRPLARFQLNEAVNLLEKGAFLRPKYADSVTAFVEQEMAAVRGRGLEWVRRRIRRHGGGGERLPRPLRQVIPALEAPRRPAAGPRPDCPGRQGRVSQPTLARFVERQDDSR